MKKLILLGVVLLIIMKGIAQDTICLNNGQKSISNFDSKDKASIYYFLDSSGLCEFKDIQNKKFLKDISQKTKSIANNFNGTVWFKFSLKNCGDKYRFFMMGLGHFFSNIIFSLYDTTLHRNIEVRNGSILPDSMRDMVMKSRVALKFYLDLEQTKTFFLKAESKSNKDLEDLDQFEIQISPMDPVISREFHIRIFQGIIMGLILIMLIYHLALFLRLRGKEYFYYSLYCFTVILFYLCTRGYGYEYWGNSTLLTPDIISFLLISAYLGLALNYGNIKNKFRILSTIINAGFWYGLILFIIFVTGTLEIPILKQVFIFLDGYPYYQISVIAAGLFVLAAAIPYLKLALNKDRLALYFILASSLFFIGALILLFHFVFSSDSFILSNAFDIGLASQMFLFALGLAEKMMIVNNEKLASQEKLVNQLVINADLQGKVNRELEQKVKERTYEIENQKEEIKSQRDEIEAQRDLVTYQKERIEGIHKEVTDSINYARRIQASALPNEKLLKEYFRDSFILFKPKDIVSGDFYWFEKVESQIILTVADCTGHGVPGAFMSMLGMSLLKEIVSKEYITQPDVILKRLRKEIIKALGQTGETGEQKDGMDITLCSINADSFKMQWSGANNPCLIFKESELIELKPDKMPIAIHEKMDKFTLHEMQLQKNDIIYLYTDGYHDQFGGPNNRKFMSVRFKELLSTISNRPMAEQNEILDKTIEEWKTGSGIRYEQTDDITVMGFKI